MTVEARGNSFPGTAFFIAVERNYGQLTEKTLTGIATADLCLYAH